MPAFSEQEGRQVTANVTTGTKYQVEFRHVVGHNCCNGETILQYCRPVAPLLQRMWKATIAAATALP